MYNPRNLVNYGHEARPAAIATGGNLICNSMSTGSMHMTASIAAGVDFFLLFKYKSFELPYTCNT